MRCREMLSRYAGIAVLLLISAFAAPGFSSQALAAVDAAAHAPARAVSSVDAPGAHVPLDGMEGDVTLQQRHKAGSATASSPVQSGVLSPVPDLHACPAGIARHEVPPSGSRSPAQARILRC
ncbi:hypothetical protein AB0899_08875 [Streptomyces sp. NPDC007002]|uniref:hypothetical protein n=1 Tax=Streptomyces sp. NPDC007002 TaxID=3156910 RepID=UPI00345539D6